MSQDKLYIFIVLLVLLYSQNIITSVICLDFLSNTVPESCHRCDLWRSSLPSSTTKAPARGRAACSLLNQWIIFKLCLASVLFFRHLHRDVYLLMFPELQRGDLSISLQKYTVMIFGGLVQRWNITECSNAAKRHKARLRCVTIHRLLPNMQPLTIGDFKAFSLPPTRCWTTPSPRADGERAARKHCGCIRGSSGSPALCTPWLFDELVWHAGHVGPCPGHICISQVEIAATSSMTHQYPFVAPWIDRRLAPFGNRWSLPPVKTPVERGVQLACLTVHRGVCGANWALTLNLIWRTVSPANPHFPV